MVDVAIDRAISSKQQATRLESQVVEERVFTTAWRTGPRRAAPVNFGSPTRRCLHAGAGDNGYNKALLDDPALAG